MFKALTNSTLAAALVMAAIVLPQDAQAGSFRFGNDQRLHSYAKTKMTNPEGKRVDLCYLTETYNVIAPAYTTDRMVLCDTKTDRYWEVPTGKRLADLQQAGFLPSPLPGYQRPWWDVVLGYMLWIVLGGYGLFAAGSRMFRSKKLDGDAAQDGSLEAETPS
ncbi:MAG: hypothetical protein ACR2PI_11775 [Hyphomicrobiaceae bacterium]